MALSTIGRQALKATLQNVTEGAIQRTGMKGVGKLPKLDKALMQANAANPNLPSSKLIQQSAENAGTRQLAEGMMPSSSIAPPPATAWDMGLEALGDANKLMDDVGDMVAKQHKSAMKGRVPAESSTVYNQVVEEMASNPRVLYSMNAAGRKYITAGERMLQDAVGDGQQKQALAAMGEGAKRFENIMIDSATGGSGRVIVKYHAQAIKARMGMGDVTGTLDLVMKVGGNYRTTMEGALNLANRAGVSTPLGQNYMQVARHLGGAVADAQKSGGPVVLKRGAGGFETNPISMNRTQQLFNQYHGVSGGSGTPFSDLNLSNLRAP